MNEIKDNILSKLHEIEVKEHVKILYAAESGSRAWGVASNDSDYDVRFVYVRNLDDYLSLDPIRDVIEWQLDEVYDINGWDLKKTLKQFQRSNATLFEWSISPIVYLDTPEWHEIMKVANHYFSKRVTLHHYYHLANNTYENELKGDKVRYKKYIYALRPIFICEYVIENSKIPPIEFGRLMNELYLPDELVNSIDQMIEIKSKLKESDYLDHIEIIDNYIKLELNRIEKIMRDQVDDKDLDIESLDMIFKQMIMKKDCN